MKLITQNQRILLDSMVKDEKSKNKTLYSAGPYWDYKVRKILYWIKKKGIDDFRGLNSGVGTSYTDNLVLDYRNELGFKGRLISKITELPFIRKIYDGQINYTRDIFKNYIKQNAKNYIENEKVKLLVSKYKIKDSVNFDCVLKFKYNEEEYSCHYVILCERLDNINKYIDYKNISSFFEIGGGFGANIHLLLNNFPNVKKIIYLDIIPNLFVGTEYLKYFYGDAVKDYNFLRKKEKITFSDNQNLEILCIAPWQIENIRAEIDHFHNAASFQEMPEETVNNYSQYINKLIKKNGSISLIYYGKRNSNNNFNLENVNKFFNNSLDIKKYQNIFDENKILYYLITKNS